MGWKCCQFDLIRSNQHESFPLLSIRHAGSQFARRDSVRIESRRNVRIESNRALDESTQFLCIGHGWVVIGYTYIVANGSSCCFFLTGLKVGFSHHGRLYTVSFETASRDTQTLNLSRNVSKFYARQVVSDDRAAKPKFAALSPTRSLPFGTTSLSLKMKNWKPYVIVKVRVVVSNISSPPLKRR